LGAKIATVLVVEVLQSAVLVAVGYGLGWHPGHRGSDVAVLSAVAIGVLATIAFGGIGLLMAGRLKAEVNLAAANGLYLVFLLVGGMIVPLGKLPSPLADVAKVLPADALAAGLHAALSGSGVPTLSWVVLSAWAVAAPLAAAVSFRWE
jgi:ABC-2 type transport system permease protein